MSDFASAQFDFSNSKAAESTELTMPGTIGIFNIKKIEFGESKEKKTPFMRLIFESSKIKNAEGNLVDAVTGFNHSFYLTGGAMDRIQYLHKVMYDTEMAGNITTAQLIAKFENKQIALKVTGVISDKGKGYPDLAFAGFAKKVSEINDLKFTQREENENKAAIEAINTGGITQADKETRNQSFSTGGNTGSIPGSSAPRNSGGF